MDEDAAKRSIAYVRDQSFADLVVVIIGLAAETHPEILRTSLEKVFDVGAVVERAQEAEQHAREAWTTANDLLIEVRELVATVHSELDRFDKRMDAMGRAFAGLERKAKHLGERFAEITLAQEKR